MSALSRSAAPAAKIEPLDPVTEALAKELFTVALESHVKANPGRAYPAQWDELHDSLRPAWFAVARYIAAQFERKEVMA